MVSKEHLLSSEDIMVELLALLDEFYGESVVMTVEMDVWCLSVGALMTGKVGWNRQCPIGV